MPALLREGKSRRVQGLAASLTGSRVFWIVLCGFAFGWPLARSLNRALPNPAPVYGQMPPFQLIDQDGHPLGLADLRDRVWVAAFITTHGGDACEELSRRMSDLQYRLRNVAGAVRLVSFSVDRDTPEVLKTYGERFHAREEMWSFLTGPLTEIEPVVVRGLRLASSRTSVGESELSDPIQGTGLVLVDQEARIRGYYRADDEGVQKLLNAIGLLANLGPRGPAG